jgi:hypothetical protein
MPPARTITRASSTWLVSALDCTVCTKDTIQTPAPFYHGSGCLLLRCPSLVRCSPLSRLWTSPLFYRDRDTERGISEARQTEATQVHGGDPEARRQSAYIAAAVVVLVFMLVLVRACQKSGHYSCFLWVVTARDPLFCLTGHPGRR